MPRTRLRARTLREVETFDTPQGFFWYWAANGESDPGACASSWRGSVGSWTPAGIEAFLHGDERRRSFLAKWKRLYSPRTGEGLERAAAAERAGAHAWLRTRTTKAPRGGAGKGVKHA